MRIQRFENISVGNLLETNEPLNKMKIQHVYVPGTISLANAYVILSRSAATSEIGIVLSTLSFGIYTYSASTLSLINSAILTASASLNNDNVWSSFSSWSSTGDMNPGEYWFAFQAKKAFSLTTQFVAVPQLRIIANAPPSQFTGGTSYYSGIFARGWFTSNSTGLPISINTTDTNLIHEAGNLSGGDNASYPYIVLSA